MRCFSADECTRLCVVNSNLGMYYSSSSACPSPSGARALAERRGHPNWSSRQLQSNGGRSEWRGRRGLGLSPSSPSHVAGIGRGYRPSQSTAAAGRIRCPEFGADQSASTQQYRDAPTGQRSQIRTRTARRGPIGLVWRAFSPAGAQARSPPRSGCRVASRYNAGELVQVAAIPAYEGIVDSRGKLGERVAARSGEIRPGRGQSISPWPAIRSTRMDSQILAISHCRLSDRRELRPALRVSIRSPIASHQ